MPLPRTAAAFAALITAVPAAAQEFPALHSVTGVSADDVLNIRSAPSADAAVIGSLAAHDGNIEVVAQDSSGNWGQENAGEAAGWAALRYLEKENVSPDHPLTRQFSCFGTEPFWSLKVTQGETAEFSTPEQASSLPAGLLQAASGRLDRYVLNLGKGQAAVIRHEACSDGMSDRAFGLSADLLLDQDGLTLLTGCCSLAP